METGQRYPAGMKLKPGGLIARDPTECAVVEKSSFELVINHLDREIDQLSAELSFFYLKLEPFMTAPDPTVQPSPGYNNGTSPIVMQLCGLANRVVAMSQALALAKSRLEL